MNEAKEGFVNIHNTHSYTLSLNISPFTIIFKYAAALLIAIKHNSIYVHLYAIKKFFKWYNMLRERHGRKCSIIIIKQW